VNPGSRRRDGAPSRALRASRTSRARIAAAVALAGLLLAASLAAIGCGGGAPGAGAGSGTAPTSGASGPAGQAAPSPAGADAGTARIDPNPVPSTVAPASPQGAAPVPSGPVPGTFPLRFIVHERETRRELPAGSFEVRLLPLDPIRSGDAGAGSDPGARAGATTKAPQPDPGAPIGKAPAAPPAPGAAYRGAPEQVLVTQLDGSKWTFLAGVRPGSYAMRITAKGRRMLLEVLDVKSGDRLVERTLDPEPDVH